MRWDVATLDCRNLQVESNQHGREADRFYILGGLLGLLLVNGATHLLISPVLLQSDADSFTRSDCSLVGYWCSSCPPDGGLSLPVKWRTDQACLEMLLFVPIDQVGQPAGDPVAAACWLGFVSSALLILFVSGPVWFWCSRERESCMHWILKMKIFEFDQI